MDTLPVIDLGSSREGDGASLNRTAADVGAACRDIGFFYVVNHGAPQTVVDDVFAATKRYFALPHEKRMELRLNDDANIAGALANVLMTLSDNKVTLISIRSSGQTEQAFLDLVEKEESRGFARAYRPEAA